MFSKPILEQSGKELLKQNEPNNKNKKKRFSSMEVQTQGLRRKNKLGSKGITQVLKKNPYNPFNIHRMK
jgi:hypothetical protein